jgi:hypothetical protein
MGSPSWSWPSPPTRVIKTRLQQRAVKMPNGRAGNAADVGEIGNGYTHANITRGEARVKAEYAFTVTIFRDHLATDKTERTVTIDEYVEMVGIVTSCPSQ